MSKFDQLWIEKYRPRKIQDILLDDETKAKILSYKKSKEIPNLLLCGPPGQGKTSLAKIISQDILDCQYIYINASDENGIDTIRYKVTNFAQTKSLDGNIKVVILDEADFITPQGQAALRNTMETYSDICRFILTANIKHKIIPALQSRCTRLDIIPPLKASILKCFHILKKENIEYDDKATIIKFIKQHYPDLRKVINNLQKSIIDNKLHITFASISSNFCKSIISKLQKDSIQTRKFVIENEQEFNGDYPQLLKDLLEYIYNSDINTTKKQMICLTISNYLHSSAFVIDQEINFFGCLIKIHLILTDQ